MKIASCGFLKTMCHCTCCENLSRTLGVNPCLLQEFRALTISPISAQGEEKHVLEMCFLISFTRERSIPAPHARRMFCTGILLNAVLVEVIVIKSAHQDLLLVKEAVLLRI